MAAHGDRGSARAFQGGDQVGLPEAVPGPQRATFTLEPQGDATRVTWTMDGPAPYPAKIMHLFFDMDRMVGKDFETGLRNLEAAAER